MVSKGIRFLIGGGLGGIGGYIFYSNGLCVIIGVAIGVFAVFKTIIKKKDNEKLMRIQFGEFLMTFSTMLASGSEVCKALKETASHLEQMYKSGKYRDKPVIDELAKANTLIEIGGTPDKAIVHMAQKLNIPEIAYFAYSFCVMYRKGGNIAALAEDEAIMINCRERIESEIDVMTAEMVFSQRILLLFFPAAVLILKITAPEYIAPLYVGAGRIIMTISILIVAAAWWISEKIVRIKY